MLPLALSPVAEAICVFIGWIFYIFFIIAMPCFAILLVKILIDIIRGKEITGGISSIFGDFF